VDGRLNVNVALNRPSYSSSVHMNLYGPSYGNDGDKSPCDGSTTTHSVVHSELELNPWYVVDLGVALRISGVKLTVRQTTSSQVIE